MQFDDEPPLVPANIKKGEKLPSTMVFGDEDEEEDDDTLPPEDNSKSNSKKKKIAEVN